MKSKLLSFLGLSILVALSSAAYAVSGDIGSVATTAKTNLGGVAQLITAAAFVAGMAFMIGAIVKFKAHKDNPTQIPIGTPIALLFVGAALLFAPSLFRSGGATLYGSGADQTTISGVKSF